MGTTVTGETFSSSDLRDIHSIHTRRKRDVHFVTKDPISMKRDLFPRKKWIVSKPSLYCRATLDKGSWEPPIFRQRATEQKSLRRSGMLRMTTPPSFCVNSVQKSHKYQHHTINQRVLSRSGTFQTSTAPELPQILPSKALHYAKKNHRFHPTEPYIPTPVNRVKSREPTGHVANDNVPKSARESA